MDHPDNLISNDQAPQVCKTCKSQKRKCDKKLPRCSTCARRHTVCVYVPLEPKKRLHSASVSESSHYQSSIEVQGPTHQRVDVPTILFLDPDLLQHGQLESGHVHPHVPDHILRHLGNDDDIQNIVRKYFTHTHLWMPFISKKRFLEIHLCPPYTSRADLFLLLLSMKLIATLPPISPRNPRTTLYQAAKHFYLEVEQSGLFSIQVLHAGVLLALYELGHAIYPAAFLSIGTCARYAHALGINGNHSINSTKVLTLVEVEERRRTWWAIVILDRMFVEWPAQQVYRFVNIGCPGRPFATEDPRLDDFLPTDDTAWDQGTVRAGDACTLSSPKINHMTAFALLCQAARLLGQVLNLVSQYSATNRETWIQLDRTLQSMIAASLDVEFPDPDQITFVYSALVALYTPWRSSDHSAALRPEQSLCPGRGIDHIIEKIWANLIERKCFMDRDPEDMSPWGLFFAYRICGEAICGSAREDPQRSELVKHIKDTFLAIDVRWNAAGIYYQLLEAQQAIRGA